MSETSEPAVPSASLNISISEQQQQAEVYDNSSSAAPQEVHSPPKIQRTTTEESLVPHIGDVDSTDLLPGGDDDNALLKEETEEMSNGAEEKTAETMEIVAEIPNSDDEANWKPLDPVDTTQSEEANSPAADKAETPTPRESSDAIETVASDLTSDDSNLLLEEKFKNLSMQAKQIGETPDRSVGEQKQLPRVATLVTKKKPDHGEPVPKVATPQKATNTLPRVALLHTKKHDLHTEEENPSFKPTTKSRKHTTLPRVATMPHKPATSKAPVKEEEAPPTRSAKKLTGLPRVATMQKPVRKEAPNEFPSSEEPQGPPSRKLVGLPRVALLPPTKGIATKYVGKVSPKPVRRNVTPVPIDPHHYLRHTVASAARVNPHVASPPRPGDLVTEHLIAGGSSSTTSPGKKTTPVPSLTPSHGTVSAAVEVKNGLPTGLQEFADEHDRELEKLLAMDDDEDLEKMAASDQFVSPERPKDEIAVSQKEEVSPDDVRTMDLDAQYDGSPVHPKNLDVKVFDPYNGDASTPEPADTPNDTVLDQKY